MGLIGGKLGYGILHTIAPHRAGDAEGVPHDNDEALEDTFGHDFPDRIRGKIVLDFGCGPGRQAVAMARLGAARVIGLDLQEKWLAAARQLAREHAVDDSCSFSVDTTETADLIISKDAFEHFEDVPGVLRTMRRHLKPGGVVLVSFGPTWLHPYGGHLFSVFPWAHLVFTERSLIRWRSDFKHDGATRFSEVAGGLNQMTIQRFEQFVEESPLRLAWLDTIPIKGLEFLKHRACREFGTSIVRCELTPR